MSKFGRKRKDPPLGFEYVESTLTILENELREKVNEPHEGLRKTESQWPVHQINWQKSRYIFDMYYTFERISKQVYDYCVENKLVDAALMSKWKKPGYERLCSTYAINPQNYKFGTVSICRVPVSQLPPGTEIEDPATGCRGCASGSRSNIFGNKYGQYLAAIQITREDRALVGGGICAEESDEDRGGGAGGIDDHDVNVDVGGGGGGDAEKPGTSIVGILAKHLWVDSDQEASSLKNASVGSTSAEADQEAKMAAKRFGGGASSTMAPPGKRTKLNC